jgi:hypothetical protein
VSAARLAPASGEGSAGVQRGLHSRARADERRPAGPRGLPSQAATRPLCQSLERSGVGSALIETGNDQGGSNDDRRNGTPSPALLDFAEWFADWWLRRGRELTDPARDGR